MLSLFRSESNGLTTAHIMMCLNILAQHAFLPSENTDLQSNAQFKLFSMISQLHKFKIAGSPLRKGYCKEDELWIMRVTKLISKMLTTHLASSEA